MSDYMSDDIVARLRAVLHDDRSVELMNREAADEIERLRRKIKAIDSQYPSEPLLLNQAARCLCVPARWLREEIDAGRIPALVAGRATLVHVPTVAAILAERAKAGKAVEHE